MIDTNRGETDPSRFLFAHFAVKKGTIRMTSCASITVGASGDVRGVHHYDPTSGYARGGSTDFRSTLQRALPDLAEGGYVFDLRPLAEYPQLTHWVFRCPLHNGDIEGEFVQRLPEPVRQAAEQLQPSLFGDMALAAMLMTTSNQEARTEKEPAGSFDRVSAAYLAGYWRRRGARVGRRIGDLVRWEDGEIQPIMIQPVIVEGTIERRAKGDTRARPEDASAD